MVHPNFLKRDFHAAQESISAMLLAACITGTLLLAGCDSPTNQGKDNVLGNKESALLGTWEFSEALNSKSHYVVELTFRDDFSFDEKITNYGLHPGDGPQDVSAWEKISGTYRAESNKRFFNSESLTYWDHVYYPQIMVQHPYRISMFDDCTFTIQEDSLTLTYFSYPDDAPHLTKRTFKRK